LAHQRLRTVREFGAPLQTSTGFASWQRYCTASSSGCQPNFAALNRGRHLCSAGRPSGWALAHILVCLRIIPTDRPLTPLPVQAAWWLDGLVVSASDSQLDGRGSRVRFPAAAARTEMGDRLRADKPPQYFTKPPRPTQPPTFGGTGNEYHSKCGDALRLGTKGGNGSFNLWINV